MGEKEIREQYGGKLDKAINRAIRAETENGNAALDLLAKLSGPAASSGWTDSKGATTPEAAAYIKHREKVIAPLISKVRQTWGLPSAKNVAEKKVSTEKSKKSAGRKRGK